MVSEKRWIEAQQAEKNWFRSNKNRTRSLKKGWFFGELTNSQGFDFSDLTYFEDKTIAEIGCGAQGFVTILGGRKIGIDPLITFYKKEGDLLRIEPDIDYIEGIGELLPLSNNCIDVAICYNVLDHVKEPTVVIKEINRILKIDGLLFLQVNTYGKINSQIRKYLEKKGKGIPPHPHCLTSSYIRRLLERFGFKILRGGIRKSLKGQEILSKRLFHHSFLEVSRKILLGLSQYDLFGFEELKVVCKKSHHCFR